MSFATRYIECNIGHEPYLASSPTTDLGMIVVIPACNEPEVLRTLDSLAACKQPDSAVEVIVVVNESEVASERVKAQNDISMREMDEWKNKNKDVFFSLFSIRPLPFPKKHAGVGLARKTGMDEAARRFDFVNLPSGIIVSLDADTLVPENYLTEIEKLFHSNTDLVGTTVRFEHRYDEINDERQKAGIHLYETYMHYYKHALEFTGFPNAIYTVGSAFAVLANAYVKQGGMCRRQAGEDFYFLHKMTQFGKVAELNTTCVFPSARVSDRVPFGTGVAMQKWVGGNDGLRQTYRLDAFTDLKNFFDLLPELFQCDWGHINKTIIALPVLKFLEEEIFWESLSEIKRNSAVQVAFEKRFFQYFNAFKILRYLNYTHPTYYQYQDLNEAYQELQKLMDIADY